MDFPQHTTGMHWFRLWSVVLVYWILGVGVCDICVQSDVRALDLCLCDDDLDADVMRCDAAKTNFALKISSLSTRAAEGKFASHNKHETNSFPLKNPRYIVRTTWAFMCVCVRRTRNETRPHALLDTNI